MRAIVCLGNPGPQYAGTRHNMGFRVAEELASRHDIPLRRQRLRSVFGRGRIADEDALIIKPQTFMNRSGEAVGRVVRYFKITSPDLIVVYDDMDLELGMLRLRAKGGAAGHKGMRSVIDHLGTDEVQRVRMGIGQAPKHMTPTDWVLSEFSSGERERVQEMVNKAANAIECWAEHGIETAMNRFND